MLYIGGVFLPCLYLPFLPNTHEIRHRVRRAPGKGIPSSLKKKNERGSAELYDEHNVNEIGEE